MKGLSYLCLLVSSGLFVACQSLQSSPPPSVTDPQVLEVFNRAKAGDGDALYQMSLMYRKGLNGFPKSQTRARNLLKESVNAKNPSAEGCYDYFLAYFFDSKTRGKAINCFCEALRQNEPRAWEFHREGTWEGDQVEEIKRIMRNRSIAKGEIELCPACQGWGLEEYTATRYVGSHYEGNTLVKEYQEYTDTRNCGYCHMSWRRTPYTGYVKK